MTPVATHDPLSGPTVAGAPPPTRALRILHIVGSISPAAGGPTEAIRMLIGYAPANIESEVVTLDDPAAPFLAELPFPVHALGSARKRWYSPRLLPWLVANRTRFDGVIVHGLWEYTGLAARRAFAGHVPYVVFTHGMLDPWFKRTFPHKHRKKWLYWLLSEYWVLRSAFRVLFTTDLERELARQSFWLSRWQPMVVPLGSEPPPADTARLLAAFAERCPEAAGRRFLLYLGRIDRKKGCDLLLRAFAQTAASQPDLHLVMAGPDPSGWGTDLQAIAEAADAGDRVHWPGMLRGDAKWGAFAASEAFILPSHQENFGIAVVEALASCRPVLVSDQINIAPDVAADGSGLMERDTLDGTLRLLERWNDLSPAEREAMRRNALNTFRTRYNMRENTARILNVFTEAGASRASSTPRAGAR
jgi:glycosyltransferase involved in cell wall biosynthesis